MDDLILARHFAVSVGFFFLGLLLHSFHMLFWAGY